MKPYYADEQVTLHHGDCREITEWLAADVLVTDPPYGRGWKQGRLKAQHQLDDSHPGIEGDRDTSSRDAVLVLWGTRLAVVFGDLMLPPPTGAKLAGVYRKPSNAGVHGAVGGYRRDAEVWYLLGPWPVGLGGRSSVIATVTRSQGNPSSPQGRYGHPHAKPVDVMEQLIDACPSGTIADPFAGSGSTLVAARNLGRRAIGVELEERWCERAARRLAQDVLPLSRPPSHPTIRDPQPLTGDTVPCPECREDLDNHYPCGEPGCGCWCMDPDTPAHMLRPPQVVGS